MQDDPRYEDVVSDVKAFLEARLAFAAGEGIAEDRIWLDPGIGFGKTLEHNLELLRRLDEIVAIGRPVLVGASRKRFIGALTGRPERERVFGTVAANVIACAHGPDTAGMPDRVARKQLQLYVAVSDVDVLSAELRIRRIGVTPVVTSGHGRYCEVEDPDGYLLRFGSVSDPVPRGPRALCGSAA